MAPGSKAIEVCLEIGKTHTFAVALNWPGWSRSGKDEAGALQALVDYGSRYQRALGEAAAGLEVPAKPPEFKVVERLKGDATTNFGTPGMIPASDKRSMDETELKRQQALLLACWRKFDAVARSARGKVLRAGPRGGGRDLNRIISHVFEAEHAYLVRLGWKAGLPEGPGEGYLPDRQDILAGIVAAAQGELPTRGPRGGLRWPARYYVRRAAWHVLDHAWEIEDRAVKPPAKGK
jgi:hypothetical protein